MVCRCTGQLLATYLVVAGQREFTSLAQVSSVWCKQITGYYRPKTQRPYRRPNHGDVCVTRSEIAYKRIIYSYYKSDLIDVKCLEIATAAPIL